MDYSTTQELLFSQVPFTISLKGEGKSPIKNDFYEKGYTLLDNINDVKDAHSLLDQFMANLDGSKAKHLNRFLDRLKLAKVDKIPVCDGLLDAQFQALHFDMGLPLHTEGLQNLFSITALYFPKEGKPSEAKTRLTTAKDLFNQKTWGTKSDIESKLVDYVASYGDGPAEFNTFRLGCAGRIIDAVQGNKELIDFRDQRTDQWFEQALYPRDVEKALEYEYDFYTRAGYDVPSVEDRVNLKPGQMLILDNMAVAHGRTGHRDMGEVYQFMYGVQGIDKNDVDAIRSHVAEMLSA